MTNEPEDWIDEVCEFVKDHLPHEMFLILKDSLRSNAPTPPPMPESAWIKINKVFDEADKIKALEDLYMERGNVSYHEAHAWAVSKWQQHSPPPVPEDVKGLAERLADSVIYEGKNFRLQSDRDGFVATASQFIQSFLTAHDQKRDAETIRVLENCMTEFIAIASLAHTYRSSLVHELHEKCAIRGKEALTTHLQKLKGAK